MRWGENSVGVLAVLALALSHGQGRMVEVAYATDDGDRYDCYDKPEVCELNEYCALVIDDTDPSKVVGSCEPITSSPDCYRFPGTCESDQWCQLEDRKSWAETDNTTRGRCVSYQQLCHSCTRAASDPSTAMGLPVKSEELLQVLSAVTPSRTFVSVEDVAPLYGDYHARPTICEPDLVCTGDLIPTIPATCVLERTVGQEDAPARVQITSGLLLDYGQRWLRMGARTAFAARDGAGLDSQMPQGVSREDVHAAVNAIFEALWPTQIVGAWPGSMELLNEGPEAPLCCQWSNYTNQLSDFQASRQGASWRNPVHPDNPNTGNAPPCVWCEWDGAFNDENPTGRPIPCSIFRFSFLLITHYSFMFLSLCVIPLSPFPSLIFGSPRLLVWSTMHALTFNLPDEISEAQYSVLRTIPAFLRQHLSCSLCRSHIKEHLIDLGVPTSRRGVDWAFYFWRAHNFVNEQSEVTRCGSMDCQWGAWNSPAAATLCSGVYRYPWFMDWTTANTMWMQTDRSQQASMEQSHLKHQTRTRKYGQ